MVQLALRRHGETAWSVEGRIQGRRDVPLSEVGRAALLAAPLPSQFRALRTVTSPLARCVETARLIGSRDAVTDARLIEMHWGDWEGRRLSELRDELGAAMRENEARGWDFRPEGGESPREVLARVRPWLAEVAASGEATLAVTHRGVIRAVLALATGWDMRGAPPAKLDWQALHIFHLAADGTPAVHALNVR
jgi:2,3-bisphosphoglycerate-dependent phosphoglycerate mutase